MNRYFFILLISVFLSCSNKEPLLTTINFAVLSPGLGTAYLEYARDNGIFSKRGIELKIQYFRSGGNEGNAAIASGQIHAGTYGPPVLTAIVRGLKLKIIGSTSDTVTVGSILAGTPSIKTVEDLKDKVVASSMKGQSPYHNLITILAKHGLTESDVKMRPSQSGGLQLLKSGQVDAALLGELDLSFAVSQGIAHPLDTSGKYLESYQSGYIFATQKLIDTDPDLVRKILSGIRDANLLAINNFDKFFNYTQTKYASPNYKPDDVRTYLKRVLEIKNLDLIVYPKAVRRYLNYMVQWGDFKQAEVDSTTDSKLFDLQFLPSQSGLL
jgi:ABC-type nitrate/sulfonate/bicarbonate transport system substrate-binding protein